MSEKLSRERCHIHGSKCDVGKDMAIDYSGPRRRRAKEQIKEGMEEYQSLKQEGK